MSRTRATFKSRAAIGGTRGAGRLDATAMASALERNTDLHQALFEGHVGATLELFVMRFDGELRRSLDEGTGAVLLDL
jgi:hypothetical protein